MQRDHNHAPKTIDFWIRKTKALLHQRITTDLYIVRGTPILIQDTISEDNENGVVLLGHPELFVHLKTVTKLACDATFSITPPGLPSLNSLGFCSL